MRYVAEVRVMLRPVVNDPQGLTVRGALHQLGFAEVANVRVGKHIEIELDAPDLAAAQRRVDEMSRKLLANPVIETFSVELREAPGT